MISKDQPLPGIEDFHPRPPTPDQQINIRGSWATIYRFRHLCKSERYTYVEMLAILMDNYFEKK